ncbi:IclR family transcriptional regulator [Rhodococcus sp. D2-41]|nr:IclR family transcriptional regulator [Rhodococcus sp. D2-41]
MTTDAADQHVAATHATTGPASAVCSVAPPALSACPTGRDLPKSMLERMTLILDAFDRPSTRLTLKQIADRTRLPQSTTHRILDQLIYLHWINHGSFGYTPGRRALGLGGHDAKPCEIGEIRKAAAPHLHELHLRTGAAVHLAVLDGPDEIYLDKIGGRFAASLASRVGGRNPAHITTGGRAMLAGLDPQHIDTLVHDNLRRPSNPRDWTLGGLHKELDQIRRRRGLSIDHTGTMNFASVAMAISGSDGPVAAICLCPESSHATLGHVAPLLVEAVRQTSLELYPQDADQPAAPNIKISNTSHAT